MRKQLPLTGRLPADRMTQCGQVDRGDDETLLSREVQVQGRRQLCSRREMDEAIRLVDRGTREGPGVEGGPLLRGQYLVADGVVHEPMIAALPLLLVYAATTMASRILMQRLSFVALLLLSLVMLVEDARAGVSPELQKTIRTNTFEVVMKKPAVDTAVYEKPLPLELLPFRERNDGYRSVGTAFALGQNTYVTAAHVFAAGIDSQYGAPELRGSDGTVYAVERILRYSQHEDFVVFSLAHDPVPAGLPVNREPHIDEPVLAVGNALGEGIVIRDGLYTSATDEDQDGRWKWIRFSAAASPGNSGGPLFDGDGRVIGIVIGKSPNENLNFSLPIGRVLDGDAHKATFDQRTLTSLPFLHGTRSYSYQDTFSLPLPWPQFVENYQALLARHNDEARAELLKLHADSLFPRGPGSATLLHTPDPNGFNPFLIAQQDDGAWSANRPEFNVTELPGDGSVSVAGVSGAMLLRLVRPGDETDDAFYRDSRAFMDLALRALNLRRPVGQDPVRITSLGSARTETTYQDAWQRKWQERVWTVPFLDLYVVAELLPTPDGYAAIIDYVPSPFLREGQTRVRLLAGQMGISFRGTLTQWQAHLRRRASLPEAFNEVRLSRTPGWTLQTPGVSFTPPAAAISLSDTSLLTMTMGFALSGARPHWEIEDIWWAKDERMDSSVGLWRRTRPPQSAKLELRNQFASMRERRAPYDGEIIRDTAETFSLTRIIEVPGKAMGSFSADLLYGLTVRLIGHPSPQDGYRSLQAAIDGTQILEHGFGDDVTGATSVDVSPRAVPDTHWEQAIASAEQNEAAIGKDIRGRTLAQDIRDLHASREPEARQQQLLPALTGYWKYYPALTHNRDLWTEFLSRNRLAADTPHEQAVVDAEDALLAALADGVPAPRWGELARALLVAYIAERGHLARARTPLADDYHARTSACPPPADRTSGKATAFYGRMTRSLEDYWPIESKRLGEEGVVKVSIRVSATGCASAAAIVSSSGSRLMDDAVMKFYESIEFLPGELDGKAVDSTVTMPVVFKLKN